MDILKDHTQELRTISCNKPVSELKCVRQLNLTILNEMKKMMEQAEMRVKAFMARPVGLPTSSSFISLRPSEAKKRKGNMVDVSFNNGNKRRVECNHHKDILFRRFVIQFCKESILSHSIHICRKQPYLITDTTPRGSLFCKMKNII